MRESTAISIPPHTLLQIEALAKKWCVPSSKVLETILGDESTWQAIVNSGRLKPATMNPGRNGHIVHFIACVTGARRCPHPLLWRGSARCGCPRN